MTVKATIGFLKTDSDGDLIARTEAVIAALTGNLSFSSPLPPLPVLQSAFDDYKAAVNNAVNGGKEMTALKRAKRATLASLMRQLAGYLTAASAGDMAVLLSSGFPHQKPVRQPVGLLPTPGSPVLRQGKHSGQLHAVVRPVYGATSYNWRLALASAPNTYVQTPQTTGGRFLFKGLTPGETYVVTVNAVGAAGPSDWSDDAELMVV